MNKKNFTQWVKASQDWLIEGKTFWMFVLVLVAAILLGFVTWRSPTSIKVAGYTLQFLGMLLAIRGVMKIHEHFNEKSLGAVFWKWLGEFPRFGKSISNERNCIASGCLGLTGHIDAKTPDNPDNSIEKRIEAILIRIDNLEKDRTNHSHKITSLKTDLKSYQNETRKSHKQLEKKIQKDRKSFHTGDDLIASLVGLIWLTVGITICTFPVELNNAIDYLSTRATRFFDFSCIF